MIVYESIWRLIAIFGNIFLYLEIYCKIFGDSLTFNIDA